VEKLSKQYEVYHLWDDNGRYVLILGGKEIEREILEKTLETIARETDTQSAAAAVGITVQGANSLPVSYLMACEIIELADTSSSGIVLRKKTDVNDCKVDLLAEEVRMLFYADGKKAKQNQRRLLAAKICETEGEMNVREGLSLLMKTCANVLVLEFPSKSLLWNGIFADWPGYDEVAGDFSDKEKFMLAAVEVLDQAEQIFKKVFESLNPQVQSAIKYMRAYIGEGISIKTLCDRNGTNPAYLGHIFKTETGVFFNDYLTRLRINRSVYLLRNPDRRIKDIAVQVGFSSTSYFEKCFKDQKGVSPLKYRMESIT
jgi:two-component system response regulator YesN